MPSLLVELIVKIIFVCSNSALSFFFYLVYLQRPTRYFVTSITLEQASP